MLNEGFIVKATAAPAAVYVVAEVIPRIVNQGFGAVAVTAGGLAGVGYLLKLGHRGIKRGRASWARIQGGLDIIESTPDRFERVEQRLDRHHKLIEGHSKSLDVLADADKFRIKDAVAGDERSPVDRRAA